MTTAVEPMLRIREKKKYQKLGEKNNAKNHKKLV